MIPKIDGLVKSLKTSVCLQVSLFEADGFACPSAKKLLKEPLSGIRRIRGDFSPPPGV